MFLISMLIFAGFLMFIGVLCCTGCSGKGDDGSSYRIEQQLRRQTDIMQRDRFDRQSRLGPDYWAPNPLKKKD
jgi:hypothetical protein